jgi:hypothetical protein
MEPKQVACPDCDGTNDGALDRRDFLRTVGAAAAAGASVPLWATPRLQAAPSPKSAAETAVKGLYDTLTDEQRKKICFDWDFVDTKRKRGLLRTFVSNNWLITSDHITSKFYTKKQQDLIHEIFKGIINPKWYTKFLKQLKDDNGGRPWGTNQSIAIFGKPGGDKFEFVMTGRHMTIRADGNTEEHVAFGGPIFYGHQASSVGNLREKKGHPGNIFWHQGVMANDLLKKLEPKQQAQALLAMSPAESEVDFQSAKAKFPGIAVSELAEEHKKDLQKLLTALIEPYRKEDQDEALECLKKQGGLDKCSLAFYKDVHLSDGVWDNWRLEGPSFVWYFRGYPHVHVWVNVADDASVKLNARG